MWQGSWAETNSPPEGRETAPVVNNWHYGSGLHKFYSFYVSLFLSFFPPLSPHFSATTLASLRTLVSLETLTQSHNFKMPLVSEVSWMGISRLHSPFPANTTIHSYQSDIYHPANERDSGLIPELGRSHGGGNGNPLQYPCLENPMDRGAWRATLHGVAKSRTRLKWGNNKENKSPLCSSVSVKRSFPKSIRVFETVNRSQSAGHMEVS